MNNVLAKKHPTINDVDGFGIQREKLGAVIGYLAIEVEDMGTSQEAVRFGLLLDALTDVKEFLDSLC